MALTDGSDQESDEEFCVIDSFSDNQSDEDSPEKVVIGEILASVDETLTSCDEIITSEERNESSPEIKTNPWIIALEKDISQLLPSLDEVSQFHYDMVKRKQCESLNKNRTDTKDGTHRFDTVTDFDISDLFLENLSESQKFNSSDPRLCDFDPFENFPFFDQSVEIDQIPGIRTDSSSMMKSCSILVQRCDSLVKESFTSPNHAASCPVSFSETDTLSDVSNTENRNINNSKSRKRKLNESHKTINGYTDDAENPQESLKNSKRKVENSSLITGLEMSVGNGTTRIKCNENKQEMIEDAFYQSISNASDMELGIQRAVDANNENKESLKTTTILQNKDNSESDNNTANSKISRKNMTKKTVLGFLNIIKKNNKKTQKKGISSRKESLGKCLVKRQSNTSEVNSDSEKNVSDASDNLTIYHADKTSNKYLKMNGKQKDCLEIGKKLNKRDTSAFIIDKCEQKAVKANRKRQKLDSSATLENNTGMLKQNKKSKCNAINVKGKGLKIKKTKKKSVALISTSNISEIANNCTIINIDHDQQSKKEGGSNVDSDCNSSQQNSKIYECKKSKNVFETSDTHSALASFSTSSKIKRTKKKSVPQLSNSNISEIANKCTIIDIDHDQQSKKEGGSDVDSDCNSSQQNSKLYERKKSKNVFETSNTYSALASSSTSSKIKRTKKKSVPLISTCNISEIANNCTIKDIHHDQQSNKKDGSDVDSDRTRSQQNSKIYERKKSKTVFEILNSLSAPASVYVETSNTNRELSGAESQTGSVFPQNGKNNANKVDKEDFTNTNELSDASKCSPIERISYTKPELQLDYCSQIKSCHVVLTRCDDMIKKTDPILSNCCVLPDLNESSDLNYDLGLIVSECSDDSKFKEDNIFEKTLQFISDQNNGSRNKVKTKKKKISGDKSNSRNKVEKKKKRISDESELACTETLNISPNITIAEIHSPPNEKSKPFKQKSVPQSQQNESKNQEERNLSDKMNEDFISLSPSTSERRELLELCKNELTQELMELKEIMKRTERKMDVLINYINRC